MPIFVLPQDSILVPAYAPSLVLSETHDKSVTATSRPVEKGSNVTDHVRPEPKAFECSVFVTQTPIVENSDFLLGGIAPTPIGAPTPISFPPFERPPLPGPLGALIPQAPIVVNANPLAFPVPFNAPRDAYDYFAKLQDDAVLCTIITQAHDYTDMLLTSAKCTKSTADGTGATFALSWIQIRTVSTILIVAPLPLEPKGAPVKNKGTQATSEEKSPFDALGETLKKKSLGAALVDGDLTPMLKGIF